MAISLRAGVFYVLLALMIAGPLFRSFYTDDDFDHVEAAVDGSEFRGREGWYNYIPVAGVVWWLSLQIGYLESAIILRIVVAVLLAGSSLLLFVLVRRMSGNVRWAWLAGGIFAIHPALFEPLIRLSCMHYALGLNLQLCALVTLNDFIKNGRWQNVWLYLVSGALAILSSLHSISLIPLTAALCATRLFCGERIEGRRLWGIAGSLAFLSALAMIIMINIGVFAQSPKSSSLGQWIVEHAWMLFYLGIWHVPWGAEWYISLCDFRIAGIPLVPVLLCLLLPALYGLVLIWRRTQKHPGRVLLAFSLVALFITVFFPPKPHAMSRYMYFAGPWAGIALAWIVVQAWNLRNALVRLFITLTMIAMLGSSLNWYRHQIIHQSSMSRATLALILEALSDSRPEVLSVDNLHRYSGTEWPFPRASFYWVGQAFKAITPPVVEDSQITHLALHYADNPNWEVMPDREIDWTSDRVLFLFWDPENGGIMRRTITDQHRQLMEVGEKADETHPL